MKIEGKITAMQLYFSQQRVKPPFNLPYRRLQSQTFLVCDGNNRSVWSFFSEFIAKFMSWYKVLLTNSKFQDMKMKGILIDRDTTKGTKVK